MGKAIGGFFRFLFALLILGLLGYNTWETARLRAEIETLKQSTRQAGASAPTARGTRPGRGAASSVGAGKATEDPLALVNAARQHAERAQEHLKNKRYAEAQREVALATAAARQARDRAEAGGASALTGLRDAVRTLSEQAGTLWEQNDASAPR